MAQRVPANIVRTKNLQNLKDKQINVCCANSQIEAWKWKKRSRRTDLTDSKDCVVISGQFPKEEPRTKSKLSHNFEGSQMKRVRDNEHMTTSAI